MKNRLIRLCSLLLSLTLLLSACNLSGGTTIIPSTPLPTTILAPTIPSIATNPPSPSPVTDAIQIISIDPPASKGLSASDPITIKIRYTLTSDPGQLQVWFERFQDPGCTILGFESGPKGGSTLPGGILQTINAGSQDMTLMIPPIPPFDTAYIGVGVRLWNADATRTLVEDMSYSNCYASKVATVAHAPVAPGSGSGSSGTAFTDTPEATGSEGGMSERGTIAGIVYRDLNTNGMLDSSEPGLADYGLTLADQTCTTSLTATTPDSNGQYKFSALDPGTYCVILHYSGGIVAPGTSQQVDVLAGSSSPAFFGIWPAEVSSPPPPPPSRPAWQNPVNNFDVNNDGVVSPVDVLTLVNYINDPSHGPLPVARPDGSPYYDVNGDGNITPVDILMVINYINTHTPTTSPTSTPTIVPPPAPAPAATGRIIGWVFSDLNCDGSMNPGEPGQPGYSIELQDTSGTILATIASTGSDGAYVFKNLAAGNYWVFLVGTPTLCTGSNPVKVILPEGGDMQVDFSLP